MTRHPETTDSHQSRRWGQRKGPGAQSKRADQGVALVVTLLLLLLMSVLGLAAVLSTSSDLMINGYYANYRGAFYAADSGLNAARQDLVDFVLGKVTAPTSTTGAIPTTVTVSALADVKSKYGGSFYALNSNAAANSWGASFEVVPNSNCGPLTNPNQFQAVSLPPAPPAGTGYGNYAYNYNLCVAGRAQASQHVYVYETGQININVEQSGGPASFSKYGTWVGAQNACVTSGPSAGWLMPGIYEGPTFTNGSWTFGMAPYTFTGTVGQSSANTGYWFNSGCVLGQSTTGTDTVNGQTIAPNYQGSPPFQNGLNGGTYQNAPANSFGQEWAVLDGQGCNDGSGITCGDVSNANPPALPTQAQLNAALISVSASAPTPYPDPSPASTSVPPNAQGVYLPYSTTTETAGCFTPPCMLGGGIYVEGNASIVLTPGTDTSGNNTQIYTITQVNGSTTTTTTITTDVTANTTNVMNSIQSTSHGHTSTTNSSLLINGVPTATPLVAPPGPSCVASAGGNCAQTMLYVDGTINSLTGPGEGQGAIQNGTQLSIVANGTINITGDVKYATEPVTMNAADSLIPGNDYNQVLGIFTANGFINLSSSYADNNLQTDGSLASVGSNTCSTCGFTASGFINTWNNVGGQIQTNEYTADMDYANIYYDQRFLTKNGFVPPWYPSTNTGAAGPMTVSPTVQRISWNIIPQ